MNNFLEQTLCTLRRRESTCLSKHYFNFEDGFGIFFNSFVGKNIEPFDKENFKNKDFNHFIRSRGQYSIQSKGSIPLNQRGSFISQSLRARGISTTYVCSKQFFCFLLGFTATSDEKKLENMIYLKSSFRKHITRTDNTEHLTRVYLLVIQRL